jgi:hypothetical protein
MSHPARKRGAGYFPLFLAAVFLLFIGILVYTWWGSEKAGPVILDEKGRPRNASAQTQHP